MDDEPVIRETILAILEDEGFDALGMSNGPQAVTWAERLHPDIILADINMPGPNGIEMAIQLSPILPDCRIILFTGHAASSELLEKARAQGYKFEVLAKPINPEVLLCTLREKTKAARKPDIGQ